MRNIDSNEDLLSGEEFIEKKPKKDKYFYAISIASACFMLITLFTFTYDIGRSVLKKFEWEIALLILLLPALGFCFHVLGKKIGWILNSFYFFLLTFLFLGTLVVTIIEEKGFRVDKYNFQGIIMLLSSLVISILLFLQPVRRFYKITWLLSLIVLGASLSVFILLFILIQKD